MKRLLYIIIVAIAALCACSGSGDGVLSRGKMEDVLYDYHIMQSVIDQLPDSVREKKAQDYINAVFAKHGITEAQFDSSIIYYNRNAKDLSKIYSRLKTRFDEANEAIQLKTGNNDFAAMFADGDTANIWAGAKMIMLAGNDLMRTESYSIVCDTSCHRHDRFTLLYTPLFLKSNNAGIGQCLIAGLNIVYKNGRVVGITQQVSYTNQQQLMIKAVDDEDVEKVNIFFYYKGNDSMREACVVNNISLIQMHEKASDSEASTDSIKVKADTLKIDTMPVQPVRSLTPEEVREENKSDQTIKIETAPTIRRPNSVGPRRRPNSTKQRIRQ